MDLLEFGPGVAGPRAGFMSTIFPVAWGPVLGPTVMFRWQNRAEKKVEKGILHMGIATEDMKLPRSADYG